ncbi:hypothetical protein SDC9_143241 [bioreactor metagenome]|uniref:Uncharacterized protein n=1 Tax=bioreactor metagenome TaxID=1076179 RepID=A0A645E2R5_9ZZZZ
MAASSMPRTTSLKNGLAESALMIPTILEWLERMLAATEFGIYPISWALSLMRRVVSAEIFGSERMARETVLMEKPVAWAISLRRMLMG